MAWRPTVSERPGPEPPKSCARRWPGENRRVEELEGIDLALAAGTTWCRGQSGGRHRDQVLGELNWE